MASTTQRQRDIGGTVNRVIYAGGRRCFKVINFTRKPNGRTVEARVWKPLGLDSNISEVLATWCDA
jgi:hypothetical protein